MRALVTLIFLAGFLAWGAAADGVRDISPDELVSRVHGEHAPLILDVRTPAEFDQGHVPGAMNIPHDQVGKRMAELAPPFHRDVVVYCERGGRAGKAAGALLEAGFTVLHLEGDMSAWRAEGRPVER